MADESESNQKAKKEEPKHGTDPSIVSEITRRNWVLNIGNATAAFGLIGIAAANKKDTPELPLGLYQPSPDHLSHALMASERFHRIPAGCPTDYVRPRTGPFQSQFFSGPEFAIIRRMTELLLGESVTSADNGQQTVTDEVAQWIDLFVFSSADVREAAVHLDPLHRSLSIAYYGADAVRELETSDPQKICREGFAWLTNTTRARHGVLEFVSLNATDQIAILDTISDKRTDKSYENAGTRFFALLKTEVIRGFYTSKVGLKELDYKGNGFYVRSPGCTRVDIEQTNVLSDPRTRLG